MNFYPFQYTLLIIVIIIVIIYGYYFHTKRVFPYKIFRKLYYFVAQRSISQWSIGIYEGSSPFNLCEPNDFVNPVLSASDVKDSEASFVADPFLVIENNRYFMFFEVMSRETCHGEIGYADSCDGRNWHYRKIILKEDFHLSYPNVFKWNDDYYMVPESSENFSVRLYKSFSFPDKWNYVCDLLSGLPYIDPSIFNYENKWWIFVSSPENNNLSLYYSDNLTNGWKSHPLNPIISQNKAISRPAGRVFTYNGKLFRVAQDCNPYYGMQVFALEITKLSETDYEEKLIKTSVVKMTGKGWNAAGMHQVDLHQIGNKWISAVDGLNKRTRKEISKNNNF